VKHVVHLVALGLDHEIEVTGDHVRLGDPPEPDDLLEHRLRVSGTDLHHDERANHTGGSTRWVLNVRLLRAVAVGRRVACVAAERVGRSVRRPR
jgi:hypothetical protein